MFQESIAFFLIQFSKIHFLKIKKMILGICLLSSLFVLQIFLHYRLGFGINADFEQLVNQELVEIIENELNDYEFQQSRFSSRDDPRSAVTSNSVE